MKYLLIILMLGSGKAAHHVPFNDKPACEAAVTMMEAKAKAQRWEQSLSLSVFTVCVPQGTEIP